jgi:hypothetical protein
MASTKQSQVTSLANKFIAFMTNGAVVTKDRTNDTDAILGR